MVLVERTLLQFVVRAPPKLYRLRWRQMGCIRGETGVRCTGCRTFRNFRI